MFGITQSYITKYFDKEEVKNFCKIFTIVRTQKSNINEVVYKTTIKLPVRSITAEFKCKAFEKASMENRGYNFNTTFSFGNLTNVPVNTQEDFNKIFKLFKRVNDMTGTIHSIQVQMKDIFEEIEKSELKKAAKKNKDTKDISPPQ